LCISWWYNFDKAKKVYVVEGAGLSIWVTCRTSSPLLRPRQSTHSTSPSCSYVSPKKYVNCHHHHHHHHPHYLTAFQLILKYDSIVVTNQELLIHCPANNLPTLLHILSIIALWAKIYSAGRRLNSFKTLCNLSGIVSIVDSTSVIIYTVFFCHILINSSCKSLHFISGVTRWSCCEGCGC
jgi:hypothetical protein